jgi:site-specific DNA-methyltransferase (adenine-specific)/modification methylase|tara:strand:+ start:516 stop:1256 length:741 start_codon:yes stop_codon:yes gene_type:complete
LIDLLKGDCLEILPTLEDRSANIVLTSPPYNMNLRVRNGEYCSRQVVKEFSTKYSGYSDNLSIGEYFELSREVINQCLRIADLTFFNIQVITGNKPAIFRLMGEFSENIKEVIVWDKEVAQPAMQVGVLNSQFEFLFVFARNDAIRRSFDDAQFRRGTLNNLWRIRRGSPKKLGHGAVMPEQLAYKVIENFTKKGDRVLDPFMGTGTTGVACKQLDRNFIGIEIGDEYFEIAMKRIKEHTAQQRLF